MEDLTGIQAQHHEQQLRKELSMVAQDNVANHGDVNSRRMFTKRTDLNTISSTEPRLGNRLPVAEVYDLLLQLIRLCPLRDTEHSMSMKGYTSEQNMTTVEDGYDTADDGGPLQIRESSGYEEQHSRSFHETS